MGSPLASWPSLIVTVTAAPLVLTSVTPVNSDLPGATRPHCEGPGSATCLDGSPAANSIHAQLDSSVRPR